MKKIQTKLFIKLSYGDYGDEPGYMKSPTGQGASVLCDPFPASQKAIKNRWKKRRKVDSLIIEPMPEASI